MSQRSRYAPWEDFATWPAGVALPIVAPPCGGCRLFQPQVKPMAEAFCSQSGVVSSVGLVYDGVVLCRAEVMFPDFSCYVPREVPAEKGAC